MKKIDVSRYEVKVQTADGERVLPYDVRESIAGILFAKKDLDAVGLLTRHEIAKKVRAAEGAVLLEDAEYAVVKSTIEDFRGWTERDVEFVGRVLDAQSVTVLEAKG